MLFFQFFFFFSHYLGEFEDMKPIKKTFKLLNKKMEADGIDRGEIELLIHWKFSPEILAEERAQEEKYNASFLGKISNTAESTTKAFTNLTGITESDDEAEEVLFFI
jgi:hypothetical protein